MKKYFLILFILFVLFFISCSEKEDEDNKIVIKTGRVTFFNESSYKVIVHLDAFSGPVLDELNPGSKTIDVRVSDNHGIGTMFCMEFIHRIPEGFDFESGDIFASMIDPNAQFNRVIEENKPITIQIPQPKGLEPRSAFVKILNKYSMPCEFRFLGNVFFQTGNGNIPVPTGKTGVYKLEGIPSEGKLYHNYQVFSNFIGTIVPDFTAENGWIYEFEYNGSSVTLTKKWKFIF